MIIDTTFLIDLMNGDENAIRKLEAMIKQGEPQVIPAPVVFELYTGITRSQKSAKEKAKILSLLNGQLIIAMDATAAEKGGEIDGTLIKEGKQIGVIDCMIAGIALMKNEKVLTRNVKDFSKVPELTVETY